VRIITPQPHEPEGQPDWKLLLDLYCSLCFCKSYYAYAKLMQLEILFVTLASKVLYVCCNRRTVKNVPKYASAQFYIDNVLPRIKEKKIMSIKPFVDRLG
jgi:hypothetical protein